MTVAAAQQTESIEHVRECPVCGSAALEPLPVENLNSHDPARADRLREKLGDDFFLFQRAARCGDCGAVFQHERPTDEALQRLYDRFTEAVAKTAPTPATKFQYLLLHNPQDYLQGPANALTFLDRIGALDGVGSLLELRTYGGALPALLHERGVEHVEAATISEFDEHVARTVYGIEHLRPFTFAAPIERFAPVREQYDLIVTYEGLTHSKDPGALIRWVSAHLSPGGRAVFLHEPNTPRYRPILPLERVFNNFHMQLLTARAVADLARRNSELPFTLYRDYHPSFTAPLYVDLVLGSDAGRPDADRLDAGDLPSYDLAWWQAWIRQESTRPRAAGIRVKRGVRRVYDATAGQLREEARGLGLPGLK
ncbi:class I SAM-dependent methyltransferase [Solirubrobacter ginsenosidimutans]|uniref:Class I SAM-dependent methyltransferase n=1 Tax=Solirubrobacter ginsenosidimutans TaxID=490573 RepID=A0A9X3S4Q6_9ACTN|nr:methyltransferase domain-containing protein [Solirubrobacter ginsenosidimutans]MDA0164747.1 class I SAM-dependent methyltransferase [Solirubrobacter ginsenosidimutans]